MTKRAAEEPLVRNDELSPPPLFRIVFSPIGARRRWRNVVSGQQFHASIHQLRAPTREDDLGRELMNALLLALQNQLNSLHAHEEDRVNFTLQAPGYIHAYQSINFGVVEIARRSLRLEELLQQLSAKLNSNEALNITEGLEVTFNLVWMPRPGGRRKCLNVGTKCLDAVNRKKRCIVPIRNADDLCCARAIVTMRAHCHREEGTDLARDWNNLRNGPHPTPTGWRTTWTLRRGRAATVSERPREQLSAAGHV